MHRGTTTAALASAVAIILVGSGWLGRHEPPARPASAAAQADAACAVSILPTLGGTSGNVVAGSSNGLYVGIAEDAGAHGLPVLWRASRPVELRVGLDAAMPTGVNRAGVVVGTGFDQASQMLVGWWWAAGRVHRLPVSAGDVAIPEAIDDSGRVVGAVVADEEHADGPGADEDERAVSWASVTSLPVELAPLPGDSSAHASAIAADGTVGGVSVGSGGRPVVWNAGRPSQLPGLDGAFGQVRGFVDADHPLGEAQGARGLHAVVWGAAGGPTDLGTLVGGGHSTATSGGPDGVVGSSADPAPSGGAYDAPVLFRDGTAHALPLPRDGAFRAVAGTANASWSEGQGLTAVGFSADAVGTRRPTEWRCGP
jgi:hypothetical protein